MPINVINEISNEPEIDEIQVLTYEFKNVGKEFFNFDESQTLSYSRLIKDYSKFYSFKIPDEYSELFLGIDEAPVFPLLESPLNKYLRHFYSKYFNQSANYYKSLSDSYSKWLLTEMKLEKKYSASSILQLYQRNINKDDLLLHIYVALIYMYDSSLFNPSESINLFKKSRQITARIKLESIWKEEINYYIDILIGYSYLMLSDTENAGTYFNQAHLSKTDAKLPKFYLAICNAREEQNESCENYLKEIYENDKNKILYAAELMNIPLIKFFLKHSFSRLIFAQKDFLAVAPFFINFIKEKHSKNHKALNFLKDKLNSFGYLEINAEYLADSKSKISFLDKLLNESKNKDHILLVDLAGEVTSLFNNLIDQMCELIKEHHYESINSATKPFANEIVERTNTAKHLTQNLEEIKKEVNSKLQQSLNSMEKKINNEIFEIEEEISNLKNDSKLNPANSFKKFMVYDVILSFMVFFMGGCAGYYGSSITNISEMKNLFLVSMSTGIKWSLLSFFVGFLAAAFFAGISLMDRSNVKNRLLRKINRLNKEKEYRLQTLKKESDLRIQKTIQEYTVLIEHAQNIIEDLNKEKIKKQEELKIQEDKLIEEETKEILALKI